MGDSNETQLVAWIWIWSELQICMANSRVWHRSVIQNGLRETFLPVQHESDKTGPDPDYRFALVGVLVS